MRTALPSMLVSSALSLSMYESPSHLKQFVGPDPSMYLQNLTSDGYPMFLVPKNLLMNLTTYF